MPQTYVSSHLAAKRIREQQQSMSIGSIRTIREDGEVIARMKPENKKFYEDIDEQERIEDINTIRNLSIFLLCFGLFIVLMLIAVI